MNKKLQDYVWSILPKEFKEEVKKEYYHDDSNPFELAQLEAIFGIHNLTSDAEEEEMLCVKASKVREMYALNEKILYLDSTHKGAILLKKKLTDLFGSKCLYDELNEDNFATKKPRPAEPKNEGTHQEQCVPKNAESGTHSFSHILKDSFRKERRLNIAAQIVASMIGSDDWTTWRGGSNKEIWHNMAKSSLEIADALIAEAEKGGGNA